MKEYIRATGGKVKLELYYSPDELEGTKFLRDFSDSRFVHDIHDGNIEFNRNYVILHCSACEESHYTQAKPNCFSGGRYCALSNRKIGEAQKSIPGETILIQDIYNICTEKVIKESEKLKDYDLMGYYYNFDKYCVEKFELTCTKSILKKMDILDDVHKCYEESIDQKGTKPRAYLDDNKLLKVQKEKFRKVENFNRFPLLKINDIVYYGKLRAVNVLAFVCKHVNSELHGCKDYIRRVDGKGSHFFTLLVMGIVAVAFCYLLVKCKNQLRLRFERQLNLQVDNSINKFLERTGGNQL